MDVKNLKTQVTYRIEPKSGGGFIARASDPGVASMEAPTREELQEKIRTQAFDKLAAEFPAVKRLLENQRKSGEIGRNKHSSAFVIRSTGNETEVTELSTPEERQQFARELSGMVSKDFPELSQALAASADTKTSTMQEEGGQGLSPRIQNQDQTSVANTPIVPEAISRWPFILLALSVLGALIYFVLLHR
jgi:hypothetical protein